MPSPAEFAKKVRDANPGAYDDLSDDDLTSRVLTKHPEYADMVDRPASAEITTPAAARIANVVKAKGGNPEESGWDYVKAVGKGVAGAFGIPTKVPETAGELLSATSAVIPNIYGQIQQGVQMVEGIADAARRAKAAPSASRAVQAGVSGVPMVGAPLAAVAGPAITYAEGTAPTHAENVAAVEGGATLATVIAAPKVIGKVGRMAEARAARIANIEAARGVEPGTAETPQTTPEEVALANRAGEAQAIAKPRLSDHEAMVKNLRETQARNAAATSLSDETPASTPVPDNVVEMPRHVPAYTDVAETATMHVDSANPTPSVAEAAGIAKKLGPVKEFIDGVNPAGASEGAASAADILRRSKSEISNDAALERYRNDVTTKAFERAGDDKNIESISNFEITGRFMKGGAFEDQAAADAYSKMYQESTDAAHATLKEVYGDDRVGYVENYVRRAFKFGTEADAAKATGVLSNYVGSLSASKAPLKGRVLTVPLDEALTQMRDAGIDVKPATTNPETLRQWTVENANQARVYKQAWADAKQGELIKFVKQDDRVPQGMVQLNDRVAQVFRPTEEGPVRTGQYFAEPGVARIFNNAISKGLGGSPTFKAIRSVNNAYNQMQLGLSGFHLTGTAINAGISDMSLGLQQIIQGDVGAGAKSLGRSAVPTYSFVRDMVNGRKFINDLVADDPAARAILDEKLNPAGGRLAIDQSYRNSAYENMVKAWSNRRYIRALGNVPFAVVQKIASPLMEYAIPRVKIGAFLDLAEAQRAKLGSEATDVQIQRAYEQAWDSVDNRFGQIVHDNLFWNRTAADIAQVATRSVGWNLGTIRELGGGMTDLARGKMSARTLYSFSLPVYAGTIGAVYQFLHTGKKPESFRDLYYPQNGLTDDKGRPERASLPTYMKDVFAYSTDPVGTLEHKASPLVSLAFDLRTNSDYFGDMIRNPEETRSKQLLQMGSYALKQFQPFSVQQAMKTAAEGGPLRAGEQMMGFPSGPASMKQTPEESDRFKEARRLRNENVMNAAKRKHGG